MAEDTEGLRQSLVDSLARADKSKVQSVREELRRLSTGSGEGAQEASILAAAASAALQAEGGLEAECKELTPYAKAYISLSGSKPMYRCRTHKGDPARTVHTWDA